MTFTFQVPSETYDEALVSVIRQSLTGGGPAALPTDRDGLIALAAKVDALGPDVIGMYRETGTDDWMTQNLLRSVNVDVATPEGAVAFDTPEGIAATDLFRRFHAEGGREPIDQPSARQQMYAGQMGFYFVSTVAVRSFDREIADRSDWGTAPSRHPTAAVPSRAGRSR